MNIISRLINRIRFRHLLKGDESGNVIDGMVKAKLLYKKLSVMAHPDRNPKCREKAEEIMKHLNENRFNYSELVKLKDKIETEFK